MLFINNHKYWFTKQAKKAFYLTVQTLTLPCWSKVKSQTGTTLLVPPSFGHMNGYVVGLELLQYPLLSPSFLSLHHCRTCSFQWSLLYTTIKSRKASCHLQLVIFKGNLFSMTVSYTSGCLIHLGVGLLRLAVISAVAKLCISRHWLLSVSSSLLQ